ncbi:hypothetical protein JCM10213_008755 [Rhodosporidiobolus nylandii]
MPLRIPHPDWQRLSPAAIRSAAVNNLSQVKHWRQRPPVLLVSTLKATIALCLLHILCFSTRFANLNPHPTTLNGAVLVVVGGYPGGTVGKCFQALTLGGAGLGLGVLVYAILGWLNHSPTGQGFIFAIYVYGAALVRYGGPKYISFYLYGVIFAFNGIYGTITTGGFDKAFFLANFEAYAWGIAIVFCVNLLVLPMTSEHELRRLLVTSLQHVSTLAHLTCKTYAREIDEDEMEVRQVLVKTIRADYLALTSRLEETSYEILVSRYSLKHYGDMIRSVQGLQQALITSSSALDMIDELDPEGVNVRHLFLRAETARTFSSFRHGIDLVIAEIIDELVGPSTTALQQLDEAAVAPQADPDPEKQRKAEEQAPAGEGTAAGAGPGMEAQAPATNVAPKLTDGHALHTAPTTTAAQEKLLTISARLKREVQRSEDRHRRIRAESLASGRGGGRGSESMSRSRSRAPPSRAGAGGRSPSVSRPSSTRGGSGTPGGSRRTSGELDRGRGWARGHDSDDTLSQREERDLEAQLAPKQVEEPLPGEELPGTNTAPTDDVDAVVAAEDEGVEVDVVAVFRKAWDDFARAQQDALVALIKDGAIEVDDVLRIEAGMPSIKEMYADRLPKAWTSSLIATTNLQRLRSRGETMSSGASIDVEETPEDVPCSEALTKSYSLLFGLGQLTEELSVLHDLVTSARTKRLRFYLLTMLSREARKLSPWRRKTGMKLQEALAVLHGMEYKPVKKSWIAYLALAEKWFWKQRSLYAFKVTLGTTVYTVFALAPFLQEHVFLKIGQVSALITILVAIQPTLGGTLSTWFLQISGTGAGALVGLVVLEIFHSVGGYTYNPYGIVGLGALWFAVSSYYFYKYPSRYTQTLLFCTGYGGITLQEYWYNDLPKVRENYDSPPLRFGYTIASLVISMGISAIFQLLVFRQPARRRLRLQLADTMFALSAYNSLFQAYVNLVAPPDEAPPPAPDALAKVQRELTKRENNIQSMVLALAPTYNFAEVEPQWWAPFKGKTLLKVIKSQQIILDRLRESRTAVGLRGFNPTIHHDFANVLFPYRLHSQRLARTLFYLGATSLLAKTQLARDVPSSKPTWASFERDALVLSRRMSKLPRGEEELKRPGFLRYWFYLVSLGAVSSELEDLEEDLGELFGDPDVSNPYIS